MHFLDVHSLANLLLMFICNVVHLVVWKSAKLTICIARADEGSYARMRVSSVRMNTYDMPDLLNVHTHGCNINPCR